MGRKLFNVVADRKSKNPSSVLLAAKEAGNWRTYNAQEVWDTASALAYSLQQLGIQYKKSVDSVDTVAIISNNRPEWVITDLGTQMSGGVLTPIYPTVSVNELAYIFNEAQVKVVFIANKELYERFLPAFKLVPSLQHVFSFDTIEGVHHWSTLINMQNQISTDELAKIEDESLATIIYTSGTTGNPKGVMLSHKNIVSNIENSIQYFSFTDGIEKKALSFLPLNHIFERMCTYLYFEKGISIYYAESMDTIGDNLKEVKPVVFTTVPRLLEKVYEKIYNKGLELKGIKRALFFWALRLGDQFDHREKKSWWYTTQLNLANKLIFSKWREALGGEVIAIVTGSAACQERLIRVFTAARLTIMEGYGLTETSPVVSVNTFESYGRKYGTVGVVIPSVEVKLAEDNEILCKGPNVMMGYYKQPELTAEVIKDGWFYTGDIGTFVENNTILKLTDRKKEMFKTSGGKYVAPQVIENKFKESPFIEQIMVIGADKKFISALIVPTLANLKNYFDDHDLAWPSTTAELLKHERVQKLMDQQMHKFNEHFNHTEQIKKFALLQQEWTVDSGEITPTLKLKRKVIMEKYAQEIDAIYQ